MRDNPFSLAGRNIMITGSSSGIGRHIALACANFEANLFLNGRNAQRLQDTAARFDSSVQFTSLAADLTDAEGLKQVVEGAKPLDGLVLNAGIMKLMPLKFMNDEIIDQMFNINFIAQIKLLRDLFRAKKIKKGASIVIITSINGSVVGSKANALYAGTKAALTGFGRAISIDMGGKKVRVNCIAPGMIETEGISELYSTLDPESIANDKKKYPLGDYGQPEDVANAAIYLLSPAAKWVTGTTLVVDGGFTAQ